MMDNLEKVMVLIEYLGDTLLNCTLCDYINAFFKYINIKKLNRNQSLWVVSQIKMLNVKPFGRKRKKIENYDCKFKYILNYNLWSFLYMLKFNFIFNP